MDRAFETSSHAAPPSPRPQTDLVAIGRQRKEEPPTDDSATLVYYSAVAPHVGHPNDPAQDTRTKDITEVPSPIFRNHPKDRVFASNMAAVRPRLLLRQPVFRQAAPRQPVLLKSSASAPEPRAVVGPGPAASPTARPTVAAAAASPAPSPIPVARPAASPTGRRSGVRRQRGRTLNALPVRRRLNATSKATLVAPLITCCVAAVIGIIFLAYGVHYLTSQDSLNLRLANMLRTNITTAARTSESTYASKRALSEAPPPTESSTINQASETVAPTIATTEGYALVLG
ncbi:uncharacterized protein LOC135389806 [Ornithodoros turicata]|uniref:uncharacterized protein LOC135389806 n=1 Tax=Ornithodoros turicata TaxID=34597 RepID=UPI00313891E2